MAAAAIETFAGRENEDVARWVESADALASVMGIGPLSLLKIAILGKEMKLISGR